MKVKKAVFISSGVNPEHYPKDDLPEIAMAGRSNVGKSSLINMMVNMKRLARTSSSPGKTQTLNFYEINESFRIVDLPGYGYARVSKTQREQFAKMIDTYLSERPHLLQVLQLVDIRHAPSDLDKHMKEVLDFHQLGGIIIASKADKLSKNEIQRSIQTIRKDLNLSPDDIVIPVSAEKRTGKEEMWDLMEAILEVNSVEEPKE